MPWQPIKHIKKPFFNQCYSSDLFQHKRNSYATDCCFLAISALHPKAGRVIPGLFLRNVSISWRLIHTRKRAAHSRARLACFIQKWNFRILFGFSQPVNSNGAEGEAAALHTILTLKSLPKQMFALVGTARHRFPGQGEPSASMAIPAPQLTQALTGKQAVVLVSFA